MSSHPKMPGSISTTTRTFMGSRPVKKLYLSFGLVLLAVAVVGLCWSYWPLPAKQQNLALTPAQLQTLFPGIELPAFLQQETRQLVLSYPVIMRQGETGILTFRWESSAPSTGSPTSANPRVLIETRLDMVGIFQNPTGSIDAPLIPGQTLVLERQITGIADGTYSGTLWSYINPAPSANNPSGSNTFQPVAAQDIELQIISLFGLDFFTARSMGVSCLVFAFGLILYAFLAKPKKARKKRPSTP
jgi:hypothetical protein